MQKRYHDFSFKIFCLTVSKNFMHQRGGIKFLRRRLFVTQYRKFSLEQFGVSISYRKILCIRRVYHLTPLKNLSHSADKIRRGTLLCIERILVSKILSKGGGKLHGFVEIFLTGPKKLRLGTVLCFRKFMVGKKIFHG